MTDIFGNTKRFNLTQELTDEIVQTITPDFMASSGIVTDNSLTLYDGTGGRDLKSDSKLIYESDCLTVPQICRTDLQWYYRRTIGRLASSTVSTNPEEFNLFTPSGTHSVFSLTNQQTENNGTDITFSSNHWNLNSGITYKVDVYCNFDPDNLQNTMDWNLRLGSDSSNPPTYISRSTTATIADNAPTSMQISYIWNTSVDGTNLYVYLTKNTAGDYITARNDYQVAITIFRF